VTDWDSGYDIVVVGSGVAGLTAAVTAAGGGISLGQSSVFGFVAAESITQAGTGRDPRSP
jgi:thioredoxin reductase